MSRLVGVGFLVGAKDDGASETFENVSESADRVADAAENAGDRGERGGNMLRRALEGIASVNLANISGTLDSIAERAGAGGIGMQATALESFGAQFNQTFRSAQARLGSMGDALNAHRGEIANLAHTYNISGDEILNSLGPLVRMGVDIEEVFGEGAIRALGGHMQAGTVNAEGLSSAVGELIGTYELAPDAAGSVVNSVLAIGDSFGFVADAGQGLPGVLEAIRPLAARFPQIGENISGVTQSVVRLAGAMVNMGVAPAEALTQATATFSALGEQREAMANLSTGLGSEFGELTTQVGISLGDFRASLENVLEDPLTFAHNMGQVMAATDESNPMIQRLVASLRDVSPQLMNVIRNAAEGGDALSRAMGPIEGAEDAFNRMGRSALTSTLTFSEQLERMRDAYQTRLNSIGRRTMPDFMSRQRDAYQRVGSRIEEFAGRDGALGALTRGFLRVRTFGLVQGLLPQLGVLGEGLGDTAEAAGPVLRVMGDTGLTKTFAGLFQKAGALAGVTRILGTAIFGVLGPIALVAGAGYLLYRNWDRLGKMWDDLGDSIVKLSIKFQTWVSSIDWRDMGDRVVSGILAFFGRIGEGAEGGMPSTAARIGGALYDMLISAVQMVGGLAVGMWDRIIEWITQPTNVEAQVTRGAQALGATIGGVLGVGMLTPLRNNIIGAFGRLFSGFGDIMTGGRGLMGGGARMALRRIPYVGAIIGVLMDLPQIIQGFETGGIVGGLRELFESVVDGLLMGLPSLIGRLTGTEDVVERIFDFLFEGLNIENIQEAIDAGQIGRAILEGIMAVGGGGFSRMLWDSLLGEGSMDAVMTGMGQVLEAVGSVFTEIGSAYSTLVEPLWEAFSEAGGQIMGVFRELWNDTLQPLFNDIWSAVSPVSEVFDTMGGDVDGIAGGFDTAAAGVRGFAEMAGDYVRNTVVPAIMWLADNALPLVVRGVQMFAGHVRRMVEFWRGAWPTIQTVFGHISDAFTDIAEAVTWWWETVTRPALSALYDMFSGAFDLIVSVGGTAFELIGEYVSWWWENVTVPVFNALRSVFSTVMGVVTSVARTAFDLVGGYVSWWWENVTLPVFNFLRERFVTVIEAVVGAARTAFNWMSSFITNRIEEAAITFDVLRNSWDAVKAVLIAGFQLVGAKVNRFLVVPFTRFEGVVVGMADTVRLAFLGVKQGILEMFQTLIEGFQSFIRGSNIPGADAIASALNRPLAAVKTRIQNISGRGGERAQLEADIARENRRRQGVIDAANRGVTESEERVRQSLSGLGGVVRNTAAQRADRQRQQAAREQQREREQEEREQAERERRRQQEIDRAGSVEERRRLRAQRQAEREAEAAAQAEARAETDARRQREREEQQRRARRGRGSRRAARREVTPEQMGEALREAVASGPGSSENPSHVIIESVNPRAGGRGGPPGARESQFSGSLGG